MLSIGVWIAVQIYDKSNVFEKNDFTMNQPVEYNEKWFDANGNVISIPGKSVVKAGEDYHIYKTVEEDSEGEVSISFLTNHTFVKAYLNGNKIYEFGDKEEICFGKTPGSGWQIVDLGNIKQGDEIGLVFNCPYNKYSGEVKNIRIGERTELVMAVLEKGQIMVILAMIPFFVGIIVMTLLPFVFQRHSMNPYFYGGVSFVMLAIWSFTESRAWQLFCTNAYAMQILNFLSFLLLAPSVLLSLNAMGFIPSQSSYRKMMAADSMIAFALIGLQVFEVADFFETLFVVHIMMFVNGIVAIRSYIKYKKQQRGLLDYINILLYVSLVICLVLDILDFYIWNHFGNGFFTRIEIFVLLVCGGLVAMKRSLNILAENIEKEAYEKMAYTDDLTGLRNRRGFDCDIEVIETQKRNVSIMYADMNGLKYINDKLGHHAGDEALKLIAGEMEIFKDEATTCYRLGGDEFCVLSFTKEPNAIEEQCKLVNQKLADYREKYGYPIAISYGINRYVATGEKTLHQCLIEADERMYEYKEKYHAKYGKYR